MISIELARRLRDAGLEWDPADGDRFFVPDRNLDDMVFSISQMTVDVHVVDDHRFIAFNGAVEWALDSIMQHEVIWLPTEGQLRVALGERFRSLERTGDGYAVRITAGNGVRSFEGEVAADCYGHAVLHLLTTGSAPPQTRTSGSAESAASTASWG